MLRIDWIFEELILWCTHNIRFNLEGIAYGQSNHMATGSLLDPIIFDYFVDSRKVLEWMALYKQIFGFFYFYWSNSFANILISSTPLTTAIQFLWRTGYSLEIKLTRQMDGIIQLPYPGMQYSLVTISQILHQFHTNAIYHTARCICIPGALDELSFLRAPVTQQDSSTSILDKTTQGWLILQLNEKRYTYHTGFQGTLHS